MQRTIVVIIATLDARTLDVGLNELNIVIVSERCMARSEEDVRDGIKYEPQTLAPSRVPVPASASARVVLSSTIVWVEPV